jgi:hypothetical protein
VPIHATALGAFDNESTNLGQHGEVGSARTRPIAIRKEATHEWITPEFLGVAEVTE